MHSFSVLILWHFIKQYFHLCCPLPHLCKYTYNCPTSHSSTPNLSVSFLLPNGLLSVVSAIYFCTAECTTLEDSADLNLYAIQEKKSLKYHLFFFYCLRHTISSPHVMCVPPFFTSNFPWKLTPVSYTMLPPCS